MFITFIMPAYNAENTLSRAVRSVIEQTDSDWELILIDDGSTDGTYELANSLARGVVQVRVVHQCNSGVSAARNLGIYLARGRYISFIDADDTISKDFVSILKKAVANEPAQILELPYDWANGDMLYEPARYFGSAQSYLSCKLQAHEGFACWRFVFLRELIIKFNIKFTTGRRTGEDQEFTLKSFLKADNCRVIEADKPLYHYWSDNYASASHSHSDGQFDYPRAMVDVLNTSSAPSMDNNGSLLHTLLVCRVVEATCWAATIAFSNGVPITRIIEESNLVLTGDVNFRVCAHYVGTTDKCFLFILKHCACLLPLFLKFCSAYRQ